MHGALSPLLDPFTWPFTTTFGPFTSVSPPPPVGSSGYSAPPLLKFWIHSCGRFSYGTKRDQIDTLTQLAGMISVRGHLLFSDNPT